MKILILALAISGTISNNTTCETSIELYRSTCGGNVLKQTKSPYSNGFYFFNFTKNGDYTVIPTSDACTFGPEARTVVVRNNSYTNINFLAAPDTEPIRFIDNGDGTITDNATKVTWLKDANCFGVKTLSEAKAAVNALENGVCGLSDNSSGCDWHMPSWVLLQRLGSDNATAWGWDVAGLPWTAPSTPFINVQLNYWTTNGVADRCEDARFIDITTGFIGANAKTTPYYVLPFKLPVPIEDCP